MSFHIYLDLILSKYNNQYVDKLLVYKFNLGLYFYLRV